MGGGNKEMLDEILLLRSGAGNSFTSPLLLAIGGDGKPFNIVTMAYGDDHVFLFNQLLYREISAFIQNLCSPLVCVLLLYFGQFIFDDLQYLLLAGQNRLKLDDFLD